MVEDADISRLARTRDARAFDRLYASNADRLYRFVLRLTCGDRSLADDVFQETWVVAVTRLASFERRSSFFGWLAGIAVNKLRSSVGSARWSEPLEDVSDGSEPELHADARLDAEALLTQLPPGYRAVLVLNAEGLTHAEIGRALDITEGTSKSQLSRARRAARGLVTGGRDD